ncbi:hypothetical protein BV22DRAFT_1135151 [Leucogyrophana mollusca]|uniref:Uncharacterized protein n=1 Tax=Leucogyrophana mollusca TaxID=85980 RepID=A0ACB8AW29_9AGAM|nr:hypothetical protein BV22DRAFT_1135151 [Leucogyrophana mollusca]
MALPPPLSQSARSSLLAHEVTLRGKLSLPALRVKGSTNGARASLAGARGSVENETVQVQDMDFELVRPTLPQTSARTSQESSLATRDPSILDSTKLDSPGLLQGGDGASMVSQTGSPSALTDASAPAAPVPHSPSSMDAHRQRELKWMGLLPTTPPAQTRKSKKVKGLLLDGVLSNVRYLVWCHPTDSKARALLGLYAQPGKRSPVLAFADIKGNVRVCFPDQAQLHGPKGPLVLLLEDLGLVLIRRCYVPLPS